MWGRFVTANDFVDYREGESSGDARQGQGVFQWYKVARLLGYDDDDGDNEEMSMSVVSSGLDHIDAVVSSTINATSNTYESN